LGILRKAFAIIGSSNTQYNVAFNRSFDRIGRNAVHVATLLVSSCCNLSNKYHLYHL